RTSGGSAPRSRAARAPSPGARRAGGAEPWSGRRRSAAPPRRRRTRTASPPPPRSSRAAARGQGTARPPPPPARAGAGPADGAGQDRRMLVALHGFTENDEVWREVLGLPREALACPLLPGHGFKPC